MANKEVIYDFIAMNQSNYNLDAIIKECSKGEFIIMLTILNYPEAELQEKLKIKKLSEILNVSVPAISKMLKGMETKGLVKRKVDLLCRRNTNVELTNKGEKVFNDNLNRINSVLERAFGSNLYESIKELTECSKKLSESIKVELEVEAKC